MLSARNNYLRPRDGHGTAPVTQIELFFDLVFVFAITQLSATLRSHFNLAGLVHAGILFASVWWAWVYTSWITNWLDPSHRPVRVMLIALMLLGLVLSAAIPEAFGARGLAFAGAYVAVQLGRSLFMLWAVARFDTSNRRNFIRITIWIAAAAVFWLAGGVFAAYRLPLWAAGLALDVVSPSLGFAIPGLGASATTDWAIDSHHLAERCAGFILIALGESITVTGATFYETRWTWPDAAGFLAAFLSIIALWWIYFDKAAERTAEAFAESDDPGRIARAAYTYVHGVLVAGIIVVAASDETLLEHPLARVGLPAALMLIGGPALYLLGNGIFRRMVHPKFPPSHIVGLALLGGLAVAAPVLNTLMLGWAAAAILGITITYSDILLGRQSSNIR